jgi:heme/copper-type cytochrome/quinol oxidase subunit 2
MSDPEQEKARNRKIAENEAQREAVSAIRVSTWAIAVAIVIGLAAVGWVLIHNNCRQISTCNA